MIKPIFVPLESMEAEEDNEPPSLDSGHDFLADSFSRMDFPSPGPTSKPKRIRQSLLYSDADLFANMWHGQCPPPSLSGPAGEVPISFPRPRFSGPQRC